MNVGVNGLGKLGLPLAALLANSGNKVYCYDKSDNLIEQLKGGVVNSMGGAVMPEHIGQQMWVNGKTNTLMSLQDLVQRLKLMRTK